MIIIKKKLSFIYKYLVKQLFKIIYGEITFHKDTFQSTDIEIEKVKDTSLRDSDNLEYSIFKIKNGRVFTDYVENVAIISNNKIIDRISYQQVSGELKSANYNSVLYKGTPYFKKKIKGKILVLTQGASGHKNYFHWLYDILPKIKICSTNCDLKKIDYFYLANLEEYQKVSLEILGLNHIKIINSDKNRHLQADEIIGTEHPWYKSGFILKEAEKLPSWIIKWVKNTFINHGKKFECNDKVFIDRSESSFSHCQIQNNQEIIEFLKEKGFTSYKVGQLSLQNQIYLFNNAKIIVGAHGAAFANLAFCKENTKIIEIKPKTHPNFVDKHISKINNLNFNLIETGDIKSKNEIKGDIFLKTSELNKFL